MVKIANPETSVSNPLTPRNNPEDGRIQAKVRWASPVKNISATNAKKN
jgi:hypothetical protein